MKTPYLLGLLALLLLTPMLISQFLMTDEQRAALDQLMQGQRVSDSNMAIIQSTITRNFQKPAPIPGLLQPLVANEQMPVYIEDAGHASYIDERSGHYVGCLKTSATQFESFSTDPCPVPTVTLHVSSAGLAAVLNQTQTGGDPTHVVLQQYNKGEIFLTSNSLLESVKLFFAGIAGWFAGWFV